MNPVDYRFATEVRRHLLAIVAEIDRFVAQQPGVITDGTAQVTADEPAANTQPPRYQPAWRGHRRDQHGSSSR
jgi:hypothetical protein